MIAELSNIDMSKILKSMSDRAARSFMRAVVFSKYIEYVDDTEYRFLFQDLISQDEYDRRK